MRSRKRIFASLTVFVVFVVLIAGAAGTGWLALRGVLGKGSSALEQWCGKQIERIAADLLRPTLRIEGFDYVYPKTLILEGVTLVDGDVTCLETPRMQLVFRDIPRLGKPIVIDTVALDAPVFRLVVRGDGTIAGFSNMVGVRAPRNTLSPIPGRRGRSVLGRPTASLLCWERMRCPRDRACSECLRNVRSLQLDRDQRHVIIRRSSLGERLHRG